MSVQLPSAASIEALHRKLDELLDRQRRASALQIDEESELGLIALKVYSAREAAKLLGIDRLASVYEIPESELPRVRRVGSSIGYYGIHIMGYALKKPPVDVEAQYERYRERIMQDRPKVRPLNPESLGKTRVM